MKCNVGTVDRTIRIILAVVFFSLFFVLEGNMRYIAAIGFVPLVTALMGWCPLYSLLGVGTCGRK